MKSIISLLLFITCLQAHAQWKEKSFPKDTSYNLQQTYERTIKYFPEARPALPLENKSILSYKNVIYNEIRDSSKMEVRTLRLDLFRPDDTKPRPAVILVHGGGWRSGDKSLQWPLATALATKGYITITPEYQLSMESQYPQAVFNIKSALRWVRANAAKYDIDTAKIAISGCSAGGQLATLVGMTNDVERFEGNLGNQGYSSTVHAVIDIDGVLNFMAPNSLNSGRKPTSADVLWLGGMFEEVPAIWKEASPAYWVTKDSPPILFINGGYDRFHAGQDEMLAMLNGHGIYTEVRKFEVPMHTFWLFHPWFDTTVENMVDFLDVIFTP